MDRIILTEGQQIVVALIDEATFIKIIIVRNVDCPCDHKHFDRVAFPLIDVVDFSHYLGELLMRKVTDCCPALKFCLDDIKAEVLFVIVEQLFVLFEIVIQQRVTNDYSIPCRGVLLIRHDCFCPGDSVKS